MPRQLTNPTSQDLYSHVLGELVPAGATVEITDEQAAQINTATGIWVLDPGRKQANRK